MSKTIVVSPLGLITQPNKYGQFPPGALAVAQNVTLRDRGVLGSWPGLQTYRSDVLGFNSTPRAIWAGESSVFAVGSNSSTNPLRWVTGSGDTTVSPPLGYSAYTSDTARVSIVSTRGRVILTGSRHPAILDSEGDTTCRPVGLHYPGGVTATVATSNTQSLADGYQRRYVALHRREQSDGYTAFSAPSTYLELRNANGSTVDPVLVVSLAVAGSSEYVTGDIVEVYRTKDQLIGTDPGSTYYLAASYSLTSTDVSNGYTAGIRDVTIDTALGAELYTNPGAEALTAGANHRPGLADDIVQHEGHTFYLVRKVHPYIVFRANSTMGTLSSTTERTYGIGTRAVTGDTTNGSASVVNVSPTTGLVIGQYVIGTGIQADTLVTNVSGSTVTLNKTATATNAGVALTFYDVIQLYGTAVGQSVAVANANSLFSTSPDVISDKGPVGIVSSGAVSYLTDVQGATFTLRPQLYGSIVTTPFAVRATNGTNYTPPLPDVNGGTALTGNYDERKYRWIVSKHNEPEHTVLPGTLGASPNLVFTGTGEVYRGVSVGGVILVFASDGLWQIYGDASGWTVRSLDPTLYLAARRAVDVMDGVVWAYTNRGLVSITPDGAVTEVAAPLIGGGQQPADTWSIYVVCDQLHHEVLYTTDSGASFYVFNTRTGSFTSFVPTVASQVATFSKALNSIVFLATAGTLDEQPDVVYFRADTSTTRMASASVRFQPLVLDDPSTLKNWLDAEYAFEGFTTSGVLVPNFSGTNYTARTVAANASESRVLVGVPRNAPALSSKVTPGFTFSSGATSNLWSLRMLAVAYTPATAEGAAR